jgi:hypothetical protein
MTFTHTTGAFNVEASLTAWLFGQLVANKPGTVATVALNADYPEKPLVPPVWSVTFTSAESDEAGGYQGGNLGGGQHGRMMYGIMEVNAWVSRGQDNKGWRAQKRQMIDAVTKALINLSATGSAVMIKDFYASADTPSDTGYRVTIRGWAMRPPPTDPNPAIERDRLLIYTQWVERV